MTCIIPISQTETCPNCQMGDHKVCAEHSYMLDTTREGVQELWTEIWDRKRNSELSQFNMQHHGNSSISPSGHLINNGNSSQTKG